MPDFRIARFLVVLGAVVFVESAVSDAATITVPDDAATINAAIDMATTPGDEIVINSNGPFVEALPLNKLAGDNVVRAGDGFTPLIVGDASIDWTADGGMVSQTGVFLFAGKNLTLSGLHLRIDLNGLGPSAGADTSSSSRRAKTSSSSRSTIASSNTQATRRVLTRSTAT